MELWIPTSRRQRYPVLVLKSECGDEAHISHEDMRSCDSVLMVEISEAVEHFSRVIVAVEFANVSALP